MKGKGSVFQVGTGTFVYSGSSPSEGGGSLMASSINSHRRWHFSGEQQDKQLAQEVEKAHRDSRGTYGSPRVYAELQAQGRKVSRKRRTVRTTDSNHKNPVAPNHSDRGSKYASAEYRQALASRGIQCSMSRKGNCWDNAVVESFFSSLKQELVYTTHFDTRHQARSALFEYIEVFYNRRRRHSSLGYLSPLDYERASLPAGAVRRGGPPLRARTRPPRTSCLWRPCPPRRP